MLYVKETKKKGRGIYTDTFIPKGETVEVSDCVIISDEEQNHIDKTELRFYVFAWKQDMAVALGLGSLFNHAENNNVTYTRNYKRRHLIFKATQDIPAGKELTINYGYCPVKCRRDYLYSKKVTK